jgi:hypothetical protein
MELVAIPAATPSFNRRRTRAGRAPLARLLLALLACSVLIGPAAASRIAWPVASNNEKRDLTWGETYALQYLALLYEADNDVAVAHELVGRIKEVFAARDDARGAFGRHPTWSFTDLSGGKPASDAGTDGMILFPIVRTMYLFRQRGLHTSPAFAADYATIIARSRETADFALKDWNPEAGAFRAPAASRDHYVDVNGRSMHEAPQLPYNLSHSMGRALVHLYQLTSKREYADCVIAMARSWRAAVSTRNDETLVWNYWVRYPKMIEDVSHGQITIDFVHLAYEAKLAFAASFMSRLATTVERRMVGSNGYATGTIDGRGFKPENRRWSGLLAPYVRDRLVLDRIKLAAGPPHSPAKDGLAALATQTAHMTTRKQGAGAACRTSLQCSTLVCEASGRCASAQAMNAGTGEHDPAPTVKRRSSAERSRDVARQLGREFTGR